MHRILCGLLSLSFCTNMSAVAAGEQPAESTETNSLPVASAASPSEPSSTNGTAESATPSSPPQQHNIVAPSTKDASNESTVTATTDNAGVKFTATSSWAGQASLAAAPGRSLSKKEVAEILKRIEPLKVAPKLAMHVRPATAPAAPRAGKVVAVLAEKHLPAPRPEISTSKEPLFIAQYQPEGRTYGNQVSVTFSQPMAKLSELITTPVPVSLSPAVRGKWNWIDTRTACFEPESKQFARSSSFTVTVGANACSLTENRIKSSKTWTFETPRMHVMSVTTGATESLSPIVAVCFDQAIQQSDIVKQLQVSVTAPGLRKTLLLNRDFELSKKDLVPSSLRYRVPEAQSVVLAFTKPLPRNAVVAIRVPKGTHSLEGPLGTEAEDGGTFSTYGPLKMIHPFMLPQTSVKDTIRISFSNRLNENTFKQSMVSIVPPIPDAKIVVAGDTLSLTGTRSVGKTYKVTVSNALQDQFGQHLEKTDSISFHVNHHAKGLICPQTGLVTIAPGMLQDFRVYSVNHSLIRIRAWKAEPEYWQAFSSNSAALRKKLQKLPTVLDRSFRHKPDDQLCQSVFDLKDLFSKKQTSLIVMVDDTDRTDNAPAWVQFTDIGLLAVSDQQNLFVFANSLSSGKPLPKVSLSFRAGDKRATETNSNGLARVPLPGTEQPYRVLIGRLAESCVILPPQEYRPWQSIKSTPTALWHTFTDRGVYRPGESVNFKGWVRGVTPGAGGDLCKIDAAHGSVKYEVYDDCSVLLARGKLNLDKYGGFADSFNLPSTPNLGPARIDIQLLKNGTAAVFNTATFVEGFRIEEFRRPEFQVTVAQSVNPPAMLGDRLLFNSEAKYYAGGPLNNATIEWSVSAKPAHFQPAGWGAFLFGAGGDAWYEGHNAQVKSATLSLPHKTDQTGCNQLAVKVQSSDYPLPLSLSVQPTVIDLNNQSYSSSTTVLVHPSTQYVGLNTQHYIGAGTPIKTKFIVTTTQGKSCQGTPVQFKLYRKDSQYERTLVAQKTVASTGTATEIDFGPQKPNQYVINACIEDEQKRPNLTEATVTVAAQKWSWWNRQDDSASTPALELTKDKDTYAPGDVAAIAIKTAFQKAEGVLTIARSGVIRQERFTLSGGHHVLKIPVTEDLVPNVSAHVKLTVANKTSDSTTITCPTKVVAQMVDLSISPRHRQLNIAVSPENPLVQPGDSTTASVAIKDASGRPVPQCQVTLFVVDEAILALTGYTLSDPLDSMYPQRDSDIGVHDSYPWVKSVNPVTDRTNATETLLSGQTNYISHYGSGAFGPSCSSRGGGGGGSAAGAAGAPIMSDAAAISMTLPPNSSNNSNRVRVRKNFCPLASFQTSVITDSQGHAVVKYVLPDNLTTYRIMAVATDGAKRFGTGESSLTARLALMARPSAPRFLNFGDELMIPVVVQNHYLQDQAVNVVLRGTLGGLENGVGQRTTIPAGGRSEFLFPLKADSMGTANFQTAVVSDKHSDAREFSIPVYTPASTETVSSYGVIDHDEAVEQPVSLPANIYPSSGGLQVSASTTVLSELSDAVAYMTTYPYECSEQWSSRIMVLAGLKDVASAFDLPGFKDKKSIDTKIKTGIKQLLSRQKDDGSFGLWSRDDDTDWPYLAPYVTQALLKVKNKGYAIPDHVFESAQQYLRHINRHLPKEQYGTSGKTIQAYSLYVRHLLRDTSAVQEARKLCRETKISTLTPETIAMLLLVLSKDSASVKEVSQLRSTLSGMVNETASTASFSTSGTYGEEAFRLFYTPSRGDAIVLLAMMTDSPGNALIPKLFRSLLLSRQGGQWNGTQENAFMSEAVDKYFHLYESATPNFIARVWLGQTGFLEQSFKGRSMLTRQLNMPLVEPLREKTTRSDATGAPSSNVVIEKKGAGRLYYRCALTYASRDTRYSELDRGFAVARTYEGANKTSSVTKDSQGRWHVKVGDLVRVKVTIKTGGRRFHVALVDPLPAGFEPSNSALIGTETVTQSDVADWQWWNHENLRDDRAEVFCNDLWTGNYSYSYSYITRATTSGTFIAPPAKAEEMYQAETFGRTASDTVIVE